MPRSKNKVASHRRRKNRLKLAKGYWGNQGNVLTAAKLANTFLLISTPFLLSASINLE